MYEKYAIFGLMTSFHTAANQSLAPFMSQIPFLVSNTFLWDCLRKLGQDLYIWKKMVKAKHHWSQNPHNLLLFWYCNFWHKILKFSVKTKFSNNKKVKLFIIKLNILNYRRTKFECNRWLITWDMWLQSAERFFCLTRYIADLL